MSIGLNDIYLISVFLILQFGLVWFGLWFFFWIGSVLNTPNLNQA